MEGIVGDEGPFEGHRRGWRRCLHPSRLWPCHHLEASTRWRHFWCWCDSNRRPHQVNWRYRTMQAHPPTDSTWVTTTTAVRFLLDHNVRDPIYPCPIDIPALRQLVNCLQGGKIRSKNDGFDHIERVKMKSTRFNDWLGEREFGVFRLEGNGWWCWLAFCNKADRNFGPKTRDARMGQPIMAHRRAADERRRRTMSERPPARKGPVPRTPWNFCRKKRRECAMLRPL